MRRDISMMDAAFKALEAHEGPITFAELMGEVAKELEMSDEEKLASLSRFNTGLTLDSRFLLTANGDWDLSQRHIFQQKSSVSKSFYQDLEEEDSGNSDDDSEDAEETYEEETPRGEEDSEDLDKPREEGEDFSF